MVLLLTISSLSGGGAERVCSVWANELVSQGYDVHILLSYRSKNEYDLLKYVKLHSISEDYEEYQALNTLTKLRIRRKLIKSIQPNIIIPFLSQVQIHTMISCVFMKRLKFIETIRNSPWHDEPKNRLWKFLWNLCYFRSDAVIVQCSEQTEYFRKSIQKKSFVVYNTVDERFLRLNQQNNRRFDSSPRIIAVGRINPQKNYPVMLKAMKCVVGKMPNVVLHIYGNGDEKYVRSISDMIKRYGLTANVMLMGRSECIEKVYSQYDYYVLSSDFEGMPNALIEAMASGLICVSTNCKTGPKDLITDGKNGFLVPVGDHKAIGQALIYASSIPREEKLIISENAKKTIVNNCSKEKSIAQLNRVINKVWEEC